MKFDKYKQYAPIVLRISMSLVFLWFGLNQFFNSAVWVGWLPSWVQSLPVQSTTLIMINGFFEVILASFLIAGKFTRVVALLLGIHLFGITFTIGYNDIGIRDFGLSLATFSIVLNGPDKFCLDSKKR